MSRKESGRTQKKNFICSDSRLSSLLGQFPTKSWFKWSRGSSTIHNGGRVIYADKTFCVTYICVSKILLFNVIVVLEERECDKVTAIVMLRWTRVKRKQEKAFSVFYSSKPQRLNSHQSTQHESPHNHYHKINSIKEATHQHTIPPGISWPLQSNS